MCLPSASIAQSVVGVEPGTRKGEVTATLAISAASKFVLSANFCQSHCATCIEKPVWGVVGMAFGLFVNLGPVPGPLQTFLCIFGTAVVCILLEKMKNKKAARIILISIVKGSGITMGQLVKETIETKKQLMELLESRKMK